MMLAACEGVAGDMSQHFDRDNPAKDPLYDLNERLTALRGAAAGRDRQSFMRPLMEALANDTLKGRGGPADPMHGYADRFTAAEKAHHDDAVRRGSLPDEHGEHGVFHHEGDTIAPEGEQDE